MKQILLLLLAAGLVSCTTKPWMVGSTNDQKKPPRIPGSGSGYGADGQLVTDDGDVLNPLEQPQYR